jgi:hypothetical protein
MNYSPSPNASERAAGSYIRMEIVPDRDARSLGCLDAAQDGFSKKLYRTRVHLPLLLYSETHLAAGAPTGILLTRIQ